MRVLLCPIGTRGDVQPMVALARALKAKGHTAEFCVSLDFREWIEREGFAVQTIDMDAQKLVSEAGDGLRRPLAFLTTLREAAAVVIAALDHAVHGYDIVLGAGPQGAAPTFCEARHIPYLWVAYVPVAIRSDRMAPFFLTVQTLPRFANRMCWWLQDRFFDLSMKKIMNGERRKLGLAPAGNSYDTLVGSHILGAFDPAFAPDPPGWNKRVEVTGFWHLDDDTPLPADLEAFLAAGEPPVYIGFGSMVSSDPREVSRAVLEAVRESGARAVISAGWTGLGRDAELPPGVKLIGPVSHSQLFPRMAAIVHHGGSGTTAAAARAGVPQVVVPHLLDQYYLGHRVWVQGLGPKAIPIGKLTAGGLAAAIRLAMKDDAMRQKAAALGEKMRSHDGLGMAVAAIEARVAN